MKKRYALFILTIFCGLLAFQKPILAQTYFSNSPIPLFGDPDISKIYEDTKSIFTTFKPDAVHINLSLTIPNPVSVEFYVNGAQVSARQTSNGYDILNYNGAIFQANSNYTLVIRVRYSQHYSNSTCGTWTAIGDILVGM